MSIERKLAAIMFTDIAGYTSLSAKDEEAALELLDTQKKILSPVIKDYKGVLHKEIGDGLLYTFKTVTDAVKCAIDIQNKTKSIDLLNLRIGIHEGEITLRDGDALGDDVNVASRIEPFAPVGGISISGKVQQNISSLPIYQTKLIGSPKLKGVNQDVKVFCIVSQGLPSRGKIKNDQENISYSSRSVILISTLFSLLVITNFYPYFKQMFLVNSSDASTASIIKSPALYIKTERSEDDQKKIEKLKRYIANSDLDSNLEALLIIEEMIIEDSTKSDYYSYRGQIFFQRFRLNKSKYTKLLEESKQQFFKSINLGGLSRESASIAYYHLSQIYLQNSNIKQSYEMIKKAMLVDKKFPGVKSTLKKINKKRLKIMES